MKDHPLSWWEQYLLLFLQPRSVCTRPQVSPTVSSIFIPILVYLTIAFWCIYLVWSNSNLVDEFYSRLAFEAHTESERRAAEQAREGLEIALQYPWTTALIAVGGVVGSLGSFFVLAFSAWLIVSMITSKWELLFPYLHVVSVSSSILSLGVVVNFVLKMVLVRLNVVLGPALLLQRFDYSDALHFAATRFDAFSVWYLGIVSLWLARLYGERLPIVIATFVSSLTILSLASHLLNMPFGLTF